MNYKTSVEALRRSNSNLGDTIKVGDRIVIPPAK